ncbi:hypothetical protein MJG53_019226 [Ovis ammon polii x Ovis aries]|uniref:Uncharacterized protein n=1 Tax=Ovis ammon polii x Ovis aries TaxID=2918886 RepID=A0ACB9U2U8_9CETA|nr:hypothetical protein MJG53_019226 [Ovis ammon polii x Ovis aries]
MFCDEDGDLAHEFYEETIVTKNGQKRAKLRRVHKNLIPQGTVKLDPPPPPPPPRIHVDFPVILYERQVAPKRGPEVGKDSRKGKTEREDRERYMRRLDGDQALRL